MAITNGYATLAQVKSALRITDSVDDALIETAIEAASREIDGYCQRVFYSTTSTRVFNPTNAFLVLTDDIVSITTLKTSLTGTAYDQTWSATDYQLEPLNGIADGITQPFTRIAAIGSLMFPIWNYDLQVRNKAGVEIAGTFGWASVPTAIRQATILLAMRQFKRYDSPLGVAGFGDIGVVRIGRVDPDVEALIMPYKRVTAA